MCPRKVHPSCLARWQLQQAGRKEESSCRFCNASLPDWKQILAPAPPSQPVEPIMVVSLGGRCVKLRVRPGPEGMAAFRQQVRELFNIPADVEFECSFKCKAPSGDTVQLEGLASYDAATHVASLMAAQRAAAAARRANSVPHHRAPGTSGGGSGSGDTTSAQQPLHYHHHHHPHMQHPEQQPYMHTQPHQTYQQAQCAPPPQLQPQPPPLESSHSAPEPLQYHPQPLAAAAVATAAYPYPYPAPAPSYPLGHPHMLSA
ncbi:hypothetical protein HYH02_013267 [Chlamydomonas schloesseri]|uniref:RING-CH-type domain-containing protein n=1 Tax=Chlamydomonas schloesseri TaxID=2026947 RepID=A0A835T4P0_9CHLO|nr:hypothetical protein HYH02_013267 [Chlamydomonas schloesseri]|eukprot:KAG2431690.1 hypothetical protein HYH02_013267 [Chlamydomonas schloesseri]